MSERATADSSTTQAAQNAPCCAQEDSGLYAANFRLSTFEEKPLMQDAVMLLFTAIFFALAFLYVSACQKLR